MKKNRKSRSFLGATSGYWLSTIAICLLIVGSGVAVVFWPRGSVSDAYRHYSRTEGIKAYYFKDFRINDTVSVNITMLEALDSNAWNMLKNDFSLPALDTVSQKKIDKGKDLVFTSLVNGDDFREQVDPKYPECDVKAVSYLNHTICLFHTKNMEERHAVFFYNMEKAINISKKTKQ